MSCACAILWMVAEIQVAPPQRPWNFGGFSCKYPQTLVSTMVSKWCEVDFRRASAVSIYAVRLLHSFRFAPLAQVLLPGFLAFLLLLIEAGQKNQLLLASNPKRGICPEGDSSRNDSFEGSVLIVLSRCHVIFCSSSRYLWLATCSTMPILLHPPVRGFTNLWM